MLTKMIKQWMKATKGKFVTIDGRPVFVGGPGQGGGTAGGGSVVPTSVINLADEWKEKQSLNFMSSIDHPSKSEWSDDARGSADQWGERLGTVNLDTYGKGVSGSVLAAVAVRDYPNESGSENWETRYFFEYAS